MSQNQQNQPQALTICNPPRRRPQRQQKCPPQKSRLTDLFDLTLCAKDPEHLTRVSRAKKERCTVPTNPICVVGNSWMRAEIESNSTKMRKACVEVTQAFRDFSPLLLEAIASLGQKTRFLPYPSYRFVPCRFLGRLRHIVESIRAAIVPPFLPPILISLADRSTKTHWSIPSKVSQFNQLISMP